MMARSVIREDQVLDSDFMSEEEFTVASGVLQTQIDGKADIDHLHDDQYYTETEVDALIASASGTTDHSSLNNLDYASSGHTGFQPSGDYATNPSLTNTSGTLQTQIDDNFGKVAVSSNDSTEDYLINKLDAGPNTLLIEIYDGSNEKIKIISTSSSSATQLISGYAVWDSGLTFLVSDLEYTIQGTYYTSVAGSLTLDDAHSTLERIDVIYATISGTIGILKGTASADPVKPTVDPEIQIEVTFVTVAAGASEPSIESTDIYLEDAEWATSTAGGSFDTSSSGSVYSGAVAIENTAGGNNDYIDFTAPSTQDLSDFDFLEFHIKSKAAWPSVKKLYVEFYNTPVKNGDTIILKDGFYSFDSADTSNWQTINIPKADFNLDSSSADKLKLTIRGASSTIGFYIDQIRLQSGIPLSVAQPVFTTIISDSGETTADSAVDTLFVLGDSDIISTSITDDSLTISADMSNYTTTSGSVDYVDTVSGTLQTQIDGFTAGEGVAISEGFTKPAHGLSVKDAVRHTGPNAEDFIKANADNTDTSEAVGIVSSVAGNDFTVVYGGRITGLSGLTTGVNFLSDTVSGSLTATEPALSKPLLYATSSTSAIVIIERGLVGEGEDDPYYVSPLINKGDITIHNGISETRLPVGTDDQVLTADSTVSGGVDWKDVPPGVTNGDLHDHSGGDGAQINHTTLSGIGTNTHSQIDTHISDDTKHRLINDSGLASTDIWSASKIGTLVTSTSGSLQTNIEGKSDTSHLHDDRYYTETEVDDLITTISGKLDDHNELNNLDYASSAHTGFQPSGDYLTDSEFTTYSGTLQTQIDDKSDTGHLHDDRYYTETEVDDLITTATGSLTVNHSELNELDYVSSGHTGFQPSGDYATNTALTNTSGSLQTQINSKSDTSHLHDDRYYTESEVGTISGTLQTNIDGKSDTSHLHDDRYYTETEVDDLITTATGSLTVNHSELNELDYASSAHTGFQPSGDYATNTALSTTSGTLQTQIDGKGDVTNSGTSTDNAVPRYDGTTGKLLQSSAVIIDDDNWMTGVDFIGINGALATDWVKLRVLGGFATYRTEIVVGAFTSMNDVNAGAYSLLEFTGAEQNFDVTGINHFAWGKHSWILNLTSYTMTLKHEDALSSVNTRLALPGSIDMSLEPGEGAFLIFNQENTKWSVVADSRTASIPPLTTKGDLYTYDTDNARLPVGTENQVLRVAPGEATGLKWSPGLPSDLALVVTGRSTTYTLTTTPTPLTFNITSEENNTSILQHNDSTTSRIDLKEVGYYLVTINFDVRLYSTNDDCHFRFLKNGSPIFTHQIQNDDSNDQWTSQGLSHIMYADATTDYVQVDFEYQSSSGGIIQANATFEAIRLSGLRGATGSTGPVGTSGTNGMDGDITWEGDWSGATPYTANQAVTSSGNSYVCISSNTNQIPPNATYWDLMASKGNTGAGLVGLKSQLDLLTAGKIDTDATDLWKTKNGTSFVYHGQAADITAIYATQGEADSGGTEATVKVVRRRSAANVDVCSAFSLSATADTETTGTVNTSNDDLQDADILRLVVVEGTNNDAKDLHVCIRTEMT